METVQSFQPVGSSEVKIKSPGGQTGAERQSKKTYRDFNLNPVRRPDTEAVNWTEQSLLNELIKGDLELGEVHSLGLKAEDFYSETHRLLFRAIEHLHDRVEPIDQLTVSIELKKGPTRPDGGDWTTYITNVLGPAIPIMGNVAHHVEVIRKTSRLRKTAETAYRLYEAAGKGETENARMLIERIAELQSQDTRTESCLKPVSAADLPDIEPPESLWGGLFYPECVTQLNAEPGAGKSTLGYSWAGLGAQKREFLCESFSRSIKTLYIDLETPAWLQPHKIENICDGERPLDFHLLGGDFKLSRDIDDLLRLCRTERYDLVIFDTQSKALGQEDENSNTEGNKDGALLTQLARKTGTAILLVHHTAKSGGKGVYSGRGASAISGSVDIVCNLEILDADSLKLSVAKSRVPSKFHSITMRKVGNDQFKRVDAQAGNAGIELNRIQDFILDLLSDGTECRTSEIQERAKQEGFAKRTVERSLKRLREAGKIYQLKLGVYALSSNLADTDTESDWIPECIAENSPPTPPTL